MDNHEQHIDQAFQHRLRDASVPPPAFVWPAVEKELRKRKRKLLVWWWTGGSALLLAAASWYWVNHQAVNEAVALPATPNQEILRPSTTIASESSMTSAALPNNQATNEQPAFHESYIADTRIKQDQTGNTRKLPGRVEKKSAGTIPVVSSFSFPLSENTTIYTPAATPQAANITPEYQTKNIVPELLPTTPGLLITHPIKPASKSWPVKITKKKKEKSDNCYDFASHRNALLLEAYLGPVSAGKSLSVANPENNKYLIRRLQTEGHGWGFNGGLRATYLFREHFSVSAGLQYEQFTEVFSYDDPAFVYVLTRAGVDPQTGAPTLDTLDVSFVKETTKIYNRYGFLEVPLSIGYELRQGRGGIRVQGGTSINLLFHKRGAIISQATDKPARFTPDKGSIDVFNTNAGLSLQGSVQFFWSMEPRTRLFAEPYYRKILDPLTLESHPVTQRLDIWGVRLGMTKIF